MSKIHLGYFHDVLLEGVEGIVAFGDETVADGSLARGLTLEGLDVVLVETGRLVDIAYVEGAEGRRRGYLTVGTLPVLELDVVLVS